jgi:hypothetical protein
VTSQHPIHFAEFDPKLCAFGHDVFLPCQSFVKVYAEVFGVVCLRDLGVIELYRRALAVFQGKRYV